MKKITVDDSRNPSKQTQSFLARIFHTHRDEEAAKPGEARQANILKPGCMSTYCPSQNVSPTQHPSVFPDSAVDQHEISGLEPLFKVTEAHHKEGPCSTRQPIVAAVDVENKFLPWRVLHLPYPRETTECSYFKLQWVEHGKIKLPRISLQKRTLEKPGLSVDYDLLCQQLESILNQEDAAGYDLTSMYPTHSGAYSLSTLPKRPHHQFLKKETPSHHLQGKEALILVFKKKVLPLSEAL